ncbi:MAG TPA: heparan-alpha-glucosaminide N-acetyltransferase domain-containing protein [Pyrinomonadaceae bacterium]|nr:heparan-alpha-glucosaminide N-acetyltransferase domain-containing protein [Pyrinomonadaceae bacterium]
MSESAVKQRRITSVDLLRGLVMVIMLLDHTREYINSDAFLFSPTDLSKTTTALFFTRWITHFCAPTFVFLAGTSIYLQLLKRKSTSTLSRFLLTRGIWLIVVEFTIVRFAVFFDFDYSFFGLAEVIWIFGVSMIVMAGLVCLPTAAVAMFGLVMIAGHNLLDVFSLPPAISMAGTPPLSFWQSIWLFLHQPGFVPLFGGASKIFVAYPLIPWVGVMAAGYALGSMYRWERERRQRVLLKIGAVAVILFIILRAINVYGDPSPWQHQSSLWFTFLSFLNTTKYPVSLLFLLMTLGPALIFLAVVDQAKGDILIQRILLTFGRVPLFYFILQMVVAHLAGVVLGYFAGFDVGFWFTNYPFTDNIKPPPGYGFSLRVTYAAWVAGLALLYPICLWYGNIKQRSRHWLFSYM